jgi:hypothetical protein
MLPVSSSPTASAWLCLRAQPENTAVASLILNLVPVRNALLDLSKQVLAATTLVASVSVYATLVPNMKPEHQLHRTIVCAKKSPFVVRMSI